MRKRHFKGGEEPNKTTFFERLKIIAEYIKNNAPVLFNVTQYIDCNKDVKEKNVGYFLAMIVLFLVLYILPAIIFILSIAYLGLSFKKAKFYKSKMIYNEVLELHKIGDIYVSDYIITIVTLLIIYIIAIIYIYYTSRICYNLLETNMNIIYVFILMCVIAIVLHTLLFIEFMNKIGPIKNNLTTNLTSHFDYQYIDFLNTKNSNIILANSTENLKAYIDSVISDLKMKSPNSDIIQNSKGSNDSTVTEAYNKIVNSILTYAIIYKMQVNKYAEHYNITVDKSFFSNINNVILSVNTETNDLIDIDFSKNCVNANIDGVNNTSVLMKDVCNDCNTIKTDLNNTINDLKIKIWDVSLPPKLILALFLFLIVDTYIYILSTLR